MPHHKKHHDGDAAQPLHTDLSSPTGDVVGPADLPPGAEPAGDVLVLLQKAEAEVTELRDAFLRARAETDNVRRQSREEITKAAKFGGERLAGDLLAVKDALELALATDNASAEQIREGVALTLKQLVAAFEKAQVQEIDPQGQPFDPHRHQAMQMVEADAPANTVVQVFQKGYLIHDRVLRPAMVLVAKEK